MKKIRTNVRAGSSFNHNARASKPKAKLAGKRVRGGVAVQSGTRAGFVIKGN